MLPDSGDRGGRSKNCLLLSNDYRVVDVYISVSNSDNSWLCYCEKCLDFILAAELVWIKNRLHSAKCVVFSCRQNYLFAYKSRHLFSSIGLFCNLSDKVRFLSRYELKFTQPRASSMTFKIVSDSYRPKMSPQPAAALLIGCQQLTNQLTFQLLMGQLRLARARTRHWNLPLSWLIAVCNNIDCVLERNDGNLFSCEQRAT